MANPISDSTEALLVELSDEAREQAENSVLSNSTRATGLELSLPEEINLVKAIKVVAATDGLSREELTALKFLMIMSGIPHDLQDHVIAFNTKGVILEHVSALFTPASRMACYVLSGATTVAAVDGLSEAEHQQSKALGHKLGIEPRLVDLLIAHAQAMGLAMQKGDQGMVEALHRVRLALFELVHA